MASGRKIFTRRGALKGLGAIGATAAIGGLAQGAEAGPPRSGTARPDFRPELEDRVSRAPLIDTHEHLPDEEESLKAYLVTAPSNKVLTFGGDYIPVECVLGQSRIARRGIARALCELSEEGWLSERDALDLVDPLLHGNARRIFRLKEKKAVLSRVPWA